MSQFLLRCALLLSFLTGPLPLLDAKGLATATPEIGDPDPARIAEWAGLLSERPSGVGPTILDRTAWQAIGTRPEFSEILERAGRLAASPMPPLSDDLFLDYSRTGSRLAGEKRIHERSRYLTTLVFAECIENRGRFLPAIERSLADFGEQKTWLYPAHDPTLENFRGECVEIGICSSALAWDIATAAYWLGDKLSPASRQLVAENLERRILTPLESLVKTGKPRTRWLMMTNNHNSVTMAGVIGVAMAQIESRTRRAYFAAVAEKFIENFMSGYTSDGYCSEGVGYWNYGFGRYLLLAETLQLATDGKVDWLNQSRVETMAQFGRKIEILGGIYPTFSDCGLHDRPSSTWLRVLNQRYGWGLHLPEIRRGFERRSGSLFEFALYRTNVADAPNSPSAPPATLAKRDFFPEGGVLICRPNDSGSSFAVAMKGGHNAEHHNHNDLGSFIVVNGKASVLVDPGAEVYTSRTFSPRRYDSNVLNSFGHSVPRVTGKLQSSGSAAMAKITSTNFTDTADTLTMDLTSAYDAEDLSQLQRTFTYSRQGAGCFTVTDEVAFETPQTFESALITFSPWKQLSLTRLQIGEGKEAVAVEITSEGSDFRITSTKIDEDLPEKRVPTRIAVELKKPTRRAKIAVTIRPIGSNFEDRG